MICGSYLLAILSFIFYRNIQCFTMAMPFNMILILYVIPCKLSCDFSKLNILYVHAHIFYHFMTNKSLMTFLYVNKYLLLSIIKPINICTMCPAAGLVFETITQCFYLVK